MRDKKFLYMFIFVFIIVLSISAVSAQDMNDTVVSSDDNDVLQDSEPTSSGSVSGDVDVVTENPWNTSGKLDYTIPTDAKTVKSADVYVNVYSGSSSPNYGANANITITTVNGDIKKNESLWIGEGSSNGTVYVVNDHTTKCYSDYMIHYNITSLLTGLNGTDISIKVDTFKLGNKSFDGRIKLIALVLAYDDGDSDVINYWINDNQLWTNSNTTLTFDTRSLSGILQAYLTNIALSSQEATYKLNDKFLTDSVHKSGSYYKYNKWDITDYINSTKKTEFLAIGTAGTYGVSYKNALSVLVAKTGIAKTTVSLETERSNKGVVIAYAGTYNQIGVTVNTNKNGKYQIQLLADGVVVNTTEVALTAGSTKVNIIDPTIRPLTAATDVSGAYNNVTYTAKVLSNGQLQNESSLKAAILFNGYFDKSLSPYTASQSFYNGTITGDIVISISSNAYAKESTNRTDSWNVSLNSASNFVKAWIYVPYAGISGDNAGMFNAVFNNKTLTPVSFIRDQANVVSTSGYGLVVYDVSDLIKAGQNTLTINRTLSGGIYSPTLIYLYNTTTNANTVKYVYISNGADLVGTYGNVAGRLIKVDNTINVDASNTLNAKAYIFGAGSQPGRASIIVNGEENTTAWDAYPADSVDLYVKDITATLKNANNISAVLKNGMFTATQQIIVLTKNAPEASVITAPTLTVTYNTANNLIITLKDANGTAISGANLNVVLNGVKKQVTTGANGQATFAVPSNLAAKTYDVAITYDGDSKYASSSLTSKIIVKKANVKLTAGKKTFKAKVKTKKYTVTLKDNKGKAMNKVKLSLKVKGKTFKATTNAKGKATFKITNLKKKCKVTATVTYPGNSGFNKADKKVKITVKK